MTYHRTIYNKQFFETINQSKSPLEYFPRIVPTDKAITEPIANAIPVSTICFANIV